MSIRSFKKRQHPPSENPLMLLQRNRGREDEYVCKVGIFLANVLNKVFTYIFLVSFFMANLKRRNRNKFTKLIALVKSVDIMSVDFVVILIISIKKWNGI